MIAGQRLLFRMSDEKIYLTFDDGPEPETTPRLLDLLKANGAKATFFVVGKKAKANPQLVQRMFAEGHTVGNHSYSHSVLMLKPLRQLRLEITQTDEIIQQATGFRPELFRPPHGRFGPGLWRILGEMKRTLALWSASTGDYRKNATASMIQRRLQSKSRPGAIILLHDGHRNGPSMLKALRLFFRESPTQGLTLAALPGAP